MKFTFDMGYIILALQAHPLYTILTLCVLVFSIIKLPSFTKLIPIVVIPLAVSFVVGSFYTPSAENLYNKIVENVDPPAASDLVFALTSQAQQAHYHTTNSGSNFSITASGITLKGVANEKERDTLVISKGTTSYTVKNNVYFDEFISLVKSGKYSNESTATDKKKANKAIYDNN